MKRITIGLLILAAGLLGLSSWSDAGLFTASAAERNLRAHNLDNAHSGFNHEHFTPDMRIGPIETALKWMGLSPQAVASLRSKNNDSYTAANDLAILLVKGRCWYTHGELAKPAEVLSNREIHFGIRQGLWTPSSPIIARTDNRGNVSVRHAYNHTILPLNDSPLIQTAIEFLERSGNVWLSSAEIDIFHKRLEDAWQQPFPNRPSAPVAISGN